MVVDRFFQLILLLHSTYYVPYTIPAVTFMVIIISRRRAVPRLTAGVLLFIGVSAGGHIGTIKNKT